ncbi:MAG: hypothetical protein HXX15_18190 [Rhodopseudomonas sp.]|uniref:hypothetical protein n=1 Tax=Rhodopseudomonas sp. TaxID=1078 RepID=UPI00182DA7F6|nr:hypothetical protein [Rhodopseudomonas sp.]NVN88013.1 hypothetical protein [Rhodopseudomonas sp.]
MKPWKQQRDGVIERALETVEDVIGAKATPIDLRAPSKPAMQPALVEPAVAESFAIERLAVETAAAERSAAIGPGSFERDSQARLRGERDEIVRRVAAFKNLQIKIRLDREQYCNAVLAKTRAVLGQQAKSPR